MSKILEKPSKPAMTSIAVEQDEIASLLRQIAGPEGSASERVARAARQLAWNFRRAKAIWYGEARRIDEREMRQARELATLLEEKRREATTHAEIIDLRRRLAALEALIAEEIDRPSRRPRAPLR